MSDHENDSELSRLQRRFDELLAEAERLAEIIRRAEQDLPRLEVEMDRRDASSDPAEPPRKRLERVVEERKSKREE